MTAESGDKAEAAQREAEEYRRRERAWQDDVGYALLDKPYEAEGSAAVFHRQMDRIGEHIDAGFSGVIIEVGCGKGHLLRRLQERPDTSPRALVGLDISRAVYSLPPQGLRGVQAQGEFLPFRDACAGYVIYDGSLHHCIDYRGALREALRVLAPGGSLILFEPVSSGFSQLAHRLLDPIVFRSAVVYESPIDIRYKADFSLDVIRDELRARGLSLREEKSDFLAYPFTGCYAGSPFGRSKRFLPTLLRLEERLGGVPLLGSLLKRFAWRFTIVATKPAAAAGVAVEPCPRG